MKNIVTLGLFLIASTGFAADRIDRPMMQFGNAMRAARSWTCAAKFYAYHSGWKEVTSAQYDLPSTGANYTDTAVSFDGITAKLTTIYNTKGSSFFSADGRTEENTAIWLGVGPTDYDLGGFSALDGTDLPAIFALRGDFALNGVFYIVRAVCDDK